MWPKLARPSMSFAQIRGKRLWHESPGSVLQGMMMSGSGSSLSPARISGDWIGAPSRKLGEYRGIAPQITRRYLVNRLCGSRLQPRRSRTRKARASALGALPNSDGLLFVKWFLAIKHRHQSHSLQAVWSRVPEAIRLLPIPNHERWKSALDS